jgi:hypothetical protein
LFKKLNKSISAIEETLPKMLMEVLNDWRRLLLLKEERFSLSLSDIFALSPKDLRELQVSERLGAPSFIRVDEKRWCQPSV